MRLLLKLLIIPLLISGCAVKKSELNTFDRHFYPDLASAKLSLESLIDSQKIKNNYGFFKKFFGIEEELTPLYRPFAVAANNNYIAVSDIMFSVIYIIDKSNLRLEVLKNVKKLKLKSIVDMDFYENDLYFVDSELGKVFRYNILTKDIKKMDIQIKNPTSVKVDGRNQRIFLTDKNSHKVVITDLSGNILNEISYQMNYPIDTDIIPEKRLILILDAMNFRVLKFDYNGNFLGSFGTIGTKPGTFSKPKGLCIDKFERIYITDSDFDNFQIFNLSGELLYFIGQKGIGVEDFYMPSRVYCFEDELYVADMFNSRVKVFKLYE